MVYAKTDPDAGSRAASPPSSSRRGRPASPPPKSSTSSACAAQTPAELVFEDCEVPAENVIGEVGPGRRQVLMSGLDYERVGARRRPLGHHAESCMDLIVLPYVHQRQQFGRPIGDLPAHAGQARGHVHGDERGAGLRLRRGASACDRGETSAQGRRRCYPLRRREGDLDGARGDPVPWAATATSTSSPAGRLLRDAKLYEIGAGTSEIRRMLIGRELFEETA